MNNQAQNDVKESHTKDAQRVIKVSGRTVLVVQRPIAKDSKK